MKYPDDFIDKVIQGNCLDAVKDLPDGSIDLVCTSPEYYGAPMWENNVTYDEYLSFQGEVMDEMKRCLKKGGFIAYVVSHMSVYTRPANKTVATYPIPFCLGQMLWEKGFQFRDDIIWKKPDGYNIRLTPTLGHPYGTCYTPNWTTEHVIVYRNGNKKPVGKEDQHRNVIPRSYINKYRSDVWEMTGVKDNVHPAVFPLDLAMNIVIFYSLKGNVVLDPFGGVGTTGIACVNSGRHFILIEKEKTYCNEARKRIKKSSGVTNLDAYLISHEKRKSNLDAFLKGKGTGGE